MSEFVGPPGNPGSSGDDLLYRFPNQNRMKLVLGVLAHSQVGGKMASEVTNEIALAGLHAILVRRQPCTKSVRQRLRTLQIHSSPPPTQWGIDPEASCLVGQLH